MLVSAYSFKPSIYRQYLVTIYADDTFGFYFIDGTFSSRFTGWIALCRRAKFLIIVAVGNSAILKKKHFIDYDTRLCKVKKSVYLFMLHKPTYFEIKNFKYWNFILNYYNFLACYDFCSVYVIVLSFKYQYIVHRST